VVVVVCAVGRGGAWYGQSSLQADTADLTLGGLRLLSQAQQDRLDVQATCPFLKGPAGLALLLSPQYKEAHGYISEALVASQNSTDGELVVERLNRTGMTMGVVNEESYEFHLLKAILPHLRVDAYASGSAMLEALSAGAIDAAVGEITALSTLIKLEVEEKDRICPRKDCRQNLLLLPPLAKRNDVPYAFYMAHLG